MLRELSSAELRKISDAMVYAMRAHEGVERIAGEPYVVHPFRVALRVLMAGMGTESVIAALLHDVLEDTQASREEMVTVFGPGVAELVETLTKPSDETPGRDDLYRHQLLAGPVDARRIKIFDIADNLADVESIFSPERAREYRLKREELARDLERSLL